MLVDIPVIIIFDCQNIDEARQRAKGIKKLVTVRYDTENTELPMQITGGYLPEYKAVWLTDTGTVIDAQLTDKDLQEIARRAAVEPYDYLAGTFTEEQRQAAQDESDRKAAEDGPSE